MSEARFEPRGYLRFDLGAGRIATRDDRRHLVVPAEIVEAAGAEGTLAEAARSWGREQGKALAGLVPGHVLDEPPESFMTSLAHLLATLGWGRCELESWGGVLFAVVAEAPAGAGAAILGELLAGAFEAVAGESIECVPMEDDRFLLLGAEGAGEVRGWVGAGARAGEVVTRMLAGEHLRRGEGGS